MLAGTGDGTHLLCLRIPLRADRHRLVFGEAPGDGLRTGQGFQMGLEAVQVSHNHTLRLAPAQYGRGFLAHAAIAVDSDDFRQAGRLAAGDDCEGKGQLGWRCTVARVVWGCEILGGVVHTHPFSAAPNRMAAA